MKGTAAVQLYTVRDHIKTAEGLKESLRKIGDIGYTAVQLSAVGAMEGADPEVSVEAAKDLLDSCGVRCIATHRNWDDLALRTDQEIAFHRTLECDYTAIGGLPGTYGADGEAGYRRFLEDSAPVIARLKEAGIRFGYHNHAHEFQRIGPGRRTLWDLFVEEGGADFLLEVDLYWLDHAGANPTRIKDWGRGRVPVIHIKDKEVVPKDGPVMAPIGEGNLDWEEYLPACDAAGVEWYCVEQDTCRRDPFDCLRSSFSFLKSQGV